MHFTRFGKGDVILLVHGFLGGTGYWLPMQMGLRHAFDVIAIDLPGFSQSAQIPAPTSLSGYAKSICSLMDELGIDKFSLLGFSMGGMIAQQTFFEYPDRIQHLILYGSSAVGDLPHRFESWEASISRIEKEGVESTADRTASTWFISGKKDPYYPTCRAACVGANQESCISVMRAMQGWSSVDRLKEIKIPTLIVVGDRDRSTRVSDSIVLWEGISESILCVLPECAHGAHMEKPDLFNRIVLDFLLSNKRKHN